MNERKVKPEFYLAVDKLISSFHCSKIQAVNAVIETANILFGRNWKSPDEDEEVIDIDTAPSIKQIRASGKCIGEQNSGIFT